VRLRFTPQDTSFYDLFAQTASLLVEASDLLAELLGADREGREKLAQRLRDAEHRADESTHELLRRLNTTFITPFDRQDIYSLASGLDDCMDFMEEAGDLIVLYKIEDLPAGVADQVEALQRCAERTADAMPRLRSMKNLSDYWVEINRVENEADRAYRRVLAELFDGATDAVYVLKVREVVGVLEAAADAFEKVANTVEQIAVKDT
jgi:predicted phosphate transport protein (TIGR00153 family)